MCVCVELQMLQDRIGIELPANRAIQLLCGSFDLIILQPSQSQLRAEQLTEKGQRRRESGEGEGKEAKAMRFSENST